MSILEEVCVLMLLQRQQSLATHLPIIVECCCTAASRRRSRMVHSPMAGVWRHPPGAGNGTGLLSSQGTSAGGLQVHLLRCAEVEKSSAVPHVGRFGAASLHFQHHPQTHPNLHLRCSERCGQPLFSLVSPDPVYLLNSCCLVFSH